MGLMVNNMITNENIQKAYQRLYDNIEILRMSVELEIDAKELLKNTEAALMSSGSIIGKNAETRDAQVREGTKLERLQLHEAEKAKRMAQANYEIAAMRVREYRDLLKLEVILQFREDQ